jgi:hypothetical protein
MVKSTSRLRTLALNQRAETSVRSLGLIWGFTGCGRSRVRGTHRSRRRSLRSRRRTEGSTSESIQGSSVLLIILIRNWFKRRSLLLVVLKIR